MLTVKKSPWFERAFAVYNRNLISRRFHSFNVSGLNKLVKRDLRFPLVIYANHSTWWDGLVAFELTRRARLDFFVMMEEKQLKNLYLFQRLGAFSVVRENPRQAVKSIAYAADLLKVNAACALWIFPQGKIAPNGARPLVFFNGLARIIEKSRRVQILPVAFQYELLNEFKPEIFAKIGDLESIEPNDDFDSKTSTVSYARNLTKLLDDLKSLIENGNFDGFERII